MSEQYPSPMLSPTPLNAESSAQEPALQAQELLNAAYLNPDVLDENNLQSQSLIGNPAEFDLASMEPIDVNEDGQATLAVIDLAGRAVTVSAMLGPDKKIIAESIFINNAADSPEANVTEPLAVKAGEPATVFGRTNEEGIRLGLNTSSYISGKHFSVELSKEGTLKIVDTNSTNGTNLIISKPQAEINTVPRAEIQATAAEIMGEVEMLGEVAVNKVAEVDQTSQEAQVAEAPAPETPATTTAVVETAPEASEDAESASVEPTLTEIFTNGSTLEQALHSPTTSPETRRTLQGIIRAKQDAEKALVVEQAWREEIAPALRGFKDALPAAKNQLDRLTDVMTTGADALNRLGYAIDGGNMEEIADAVRRGNFREMLDDMMLASRRINEENVMQQVGNRLDSQAMYRSEMVKRVLSPERELSPLALDGLAEQVSVMLAAGADEATIKRELSKDVPEDVASTWRKKQSAIEELTSYARAGARETGDIPQAMIGLTNEVELYVEQMQRGRYGADDAMQLANRIKQFYSHYLDPSQRMLNKTAVLSDDIR